LLNQVTDLSWEIVYVDFFDSDNDILNSGADYQRVDQKVYIADAERVPPEQMLSTRGVPLIWIVLSVPLPRWTLSLRGGIRFRGGPVTDSQIRWAAVTVLLRVVSEHSGGNKPVFAVGVTQLIVWV
jgi:hypothetical protein